MKLTQKNIHINKLLINTDNPRFEPTSSDKTALYIMASEQGNKLLNLAKDIIENGLSPLENIAVMPSEIEGYYVVKEGNRRISCLKILKDISQYKDIKNYRKFLELSSKITDTSLFTLNCTIFKNESDCNRWILLKHTGENKGIGVVDWDSTSQERFKEQTGKAPTSGFIAYKFAQSKGYEFKKIPPITTITRILNSVPGKNFFRFYLTKSSLVNENTDEEIMRKLTHLFILLDNKSITSRNTNTISDIELRLKEFFEYNESTNKIKQITLFKPITNTTQPGMTDTAQPITQSRMTDTVQSITQSGMTDTAQPTTQSGMTDTVQSTTQSGMTDTVQSITQSGMTDTAQPTTQSGMTDTVQPTTQPEMTANVQPTTQPEMTDTVQPTTQPEMTANVQPTTQPEMTANVQPVSQLKIQLPSFYSNLNYSEIDSNNPDNQGLLLILSEIIKISRNDYKKYPISSTILCRALLEQSLIYYYRNNDKYNEMLRRNNNRTPPLEKLLEYFERNKSTLTNNDQNIIRTFNSFYTNTGTKDYFDMIIHNPHLVSADATILDNIANAGLKSFIQYLIN